jgi:hypothetical protein
VNERLVMRCLRLPGVVGCLSRVFFSSQLFLFAVVCVSVLPLLLALPQLFLLFFFLSLADYCPSCLCRLSSAAVVGYFLDGLLSISFTLPSLAFSVFESQFCSCCLPCSTLSPLLRSRSYSGCLRVSLLPLLLFDFPTCPLLLLAFRTAHCACFPDFSFSTSSSLAAICVRLFAR